ncbi:MAG TPA: acyltransferase [Ferruginibacter sp.]|nr:acyltransferase [Ferruginibacter sp.]
MKNYIPSLGGLRALSVMIVLISHINVRSWGNKVIPFPFSMLLDGNFGVNIFFVISGFLITTLLIAEENATGTISLKNFYMRRIFRIFPAYYFVLFIYFLLALFSIVHFTTQSWLSSIFYYKYLVPGDYETAHFWSLSVEEHFYLVWPLVFLFFKRQRVYFAIGVILLVFLCRFNTYYQWLPYPILSNWIFIFQRVDAIMIGCLCAMYREPISRWIEKFTALKFAPLIFILVLLLNSRYSYSLNVDHKLHLGFIMVPLAIGSSVGTITNCLIGLVLLFSISQKNWWYNFLNLPAMNYIGKLSYSLYLWQQIFLISDKLGVLSTFPINICCTIIAALLSYYFIETPFLKYKTRYDSKSFLFKQHLPKV